MLLKDFISQGTDALIGLYPKNEARSLVLILCEEYLGTHSYTHIVEPQTEVDPARMPVLEDGMARLAKGEPIQYILGYTMFRDLRFAVNDNVLIPRPETEHLVAEAVKVTGRISRSRLAYGDSASPVRILDMCTGSGCIAWSMSFAVPGAKVVGVDISEGALAVACNQDFSKEIRKLSIQAPSFVRADVLQDPNEDLGMFDVIISNPPYVLESQKAQMRPNVTEYEPSLALFVPDDDPFVFYRAVASWASRLLNHGGVGLVEINDALGPETVALFKESGFTDVTLLKDFNDKNRIVTFRAV